jgi:DNA-binding transcriptional ArsR family regulator
MKKSPMETQAEILAALAHPNRIRIVEELRGGVKCNCELAPVLKLEQSNLSRHLKILVQAGVLISWKDGLRVNFRVASEEIFRILDLALSVVTETEMMSENA